MGLDSYLERMPRYRGTTPGDINKIENYLDYQEEIKDPESNALKYSLEEWCGTNIDGISPKRIKYYKQFYNMKYSYWDDEHKYGSNRIIEQVGYWRKSNHIHAWFVKNIQNGIDDCKYHCEVTEEDLEELINTCREVLENPSLAEELLPTQSGFFFGGTSYDEYYFDDLNYTIEICENALKTTDFDTQAIYYISSW